MNHVAVTDLADQRISALKAEAAAVRLARSARGSGVGPSRRNKLLRLAVVWSFLQR